MLFDETLFDQKVVRPNVAIGISTKRRSTKGLSTN
jgi:hypothetical protein